MSYLTRSGISKSPTKSQGNEDSHNDAQQRQEPPFGAKCHQLKVSVTIERGWPVQHAPIKHLPDQGASTNRPRVPEQVSQPESLKRLAMAAEGLVRQRRGRHGRAKKGLLCLPREGGRSNNTNHTSPTDSKTTISGGVTLGQCLRQPQNKHSDTRPHCTHCSPKRHTEAKHQMND